MKANDQARKPTAFTREENSQLPIENEAQWTPSRSGYFGKEKILLPLTETEPPFVRLQPAARSLYHWNILATTVTLSKVLLSFVHTHKLYRLFPYGHHHQGLDPSIRSVSRVTTALANVSSVFQLFSFLVVCSGMISKRFGFVAFFASVKASSVCIHLSCLACM
jgi:hypothetical protein